MSEITTAVFVPFFIVMALGAAKAFLGFEYAVLAGFGIIYGQIALMNTIHTSSVSEEDHD